MNIIRKFSNVYFDKKNNMHKVFIGFYMTIVIIIVALLYFYGKFNINSVPNALLYSLVSFIACVVAIVHLYAKKGGSNRFAYFIISFMLTLSAVMLFSILFNLSDDPTEKSNVDAYFLTLKIPGKEFFQVFLFYSKDIVSLFFAALGVSSMAAAIREEHKPILNNNKAAIASVNSQSLIDTSEINGISKSQCFYIIKENDNININNNLLFAIIVINIYLIIKKDK